MSEKLYDFNYIAYDGECPMCNSYVHYIRLRDEFGFRMINLREDSDLREFLTKQGYDLNKGMIVQYEGRDYYGPSAVEIMAKLSDDAGLIKRLNKKFFSSEKRSAVIYPWLARGRGVLLKILGRKKFSDTLS
ncbi:MAG: DCC1-like thiol-disulfide oxidoreductase family protein [Pseudomonadota bacterium]